MVGGLKKYKGEDISNSKSYYPCRLKDTRKVMVCSAHNNVITKATGAPATDVGATAIITTAGSLALTLPLMLQELKRHCHCCCWNQSTLAIC